MLIVKNFIKVNVYYKPLLVPMAFKRQEMTRGKGTLRNEAVEISRNFSGISVSAVNLHTTDAMLGSIFFTQLLLTYY